MIYWIKKHLKQKKMINNYLSGWVAGCERGIVTLMHEKTVYAKSPSSSVGGLGSIPINEVVVFPSKEEVIKFAANKNKEESFGYRWFYMGMKLETADNTKNLPEWNEDFGKKVYVENHLKEIKIDGKNQLFLVMPEDV